MNIKKKVISDLSKCYALAPITHKGKPCFLVGAEKHAPCYLFSENGDKIDTVWDEPGGVMTIEALPGKDGSFLATQCFYSPNDCKQAKIVIAQPSDNGWSVRTLCHVPYVHRFGILSRNGINYLLVCCIKSDYEGRDDWRFPGMCLAAVLPDDLSSFNDEHLLPLYPIKENMLKNHGFSKITSSGFDEAVVACEDGTFIFTPPESYGADWTIECICNVPSSDSVLADFDGDGLPELGCISPFHGNSLTIYHLDEHNNYVPQWKYPIPEDQTEMIHATYVANVFDTNTWFVGWRKGSRHTIAITWNKNSKTYQTDIIDRNTGCANCLYFETSSGNHVLVAANREIDEIAYYTLTK